MRKILPLMVVGILFLSGIGAVAINNDKKNFEFVEFNYENRGDRRNTYSHIIIGEFGTATWCGYCKYAHAALKNIYAGGWHPFYYVSLVCDKNTHAYQRAISELGLTGYPTVYFDGGYRSNVGAGSTPGAQAAYNTSILDCAERDVSDIDIELDVTWNGNAEMYIEVEVINNESSTYNGHLHVYVTEIESTMGWYDSANKPYTFPFLDYAFNEDISVSSGSTWQDSITWDGHDYNDGYGNDFGDITYGNIMVIGTVFESSSDYADVTTGYRVGDNDSPNTPSNPDPEDNQTDVEINADISWTCTDPNYDVLSYDIYFGESSDPPLVASDEISTIYDPGLLDFNTTYNWKIVAMDSYGGSTSGPIWSFTTRGNDPPNTPSDPDPEDGETGVYINTDVSWTGGDPDGDDVTYDVYFGKSSPPPIVKKNQSGTSYDPSGVLDFDTTYYWQIVAWDEYNYSAVGSIWSFTTEENDPPYEPSDPDPPDGATDVDVDDILMWTGEDPNPGDKVKYDVYFGKDTSPPLVAEDLFQAAYDPGTMDLETTYYWKIVSKDSQGLITPGPIWHFTTQLEPNDPPGAPDIDGPSSGKAGKSYDYDFTAIDPDEDDVKYFIDWGDGENEWTSFAASGTPVTVNHTWAEEGDYTITAKAEDTEGQVGPESTLTVTMPVTYQKSRQSRNIFQQFPNVFPMLRYLLGLQ